MLFYKNLVTKLKCLLHVYTKLTEQSSFEMNEENMTSQTCSKFRTLATSATCSFFEHWPHVVLRDKRFVENREIYFFITSVYYTSESKNLR